MGLMGKLFGKNDADAIQSDATDLSTCPHTTMTPRWDSADDIGHMDRATGFRCEGCGQMFSPEEAEALRQDASERLHANLS
jgi:hypothetical protein